MTSSLTTTAPTTSSGRLRRLCVSGLLAVGLAAGTVAVAGPASAASYTEGCFRADRAGMNLAGMPVQLQAYHQGSWYTIANDTLPVSGCVAWNIGANHRAYYLRLLVNHRASGAYWHGTSPYYANPGQGRWSTGTGTVTCYGCHF